MTRLIRAEIRQWQLNKASIEGKIYKDASDIFDDGDDVCIVGIVRVAEGATFFLVETDFGVYKLDKDEKRE